MKRDVSVVLSSIHRPFPYLSRLVYYIIHSLMKHMSPYDLLKAVALVSLTMTNDTNPLLVWHLISRWHYLYNFLSPLHPVLSY